MKEGIYDDELLKFFLTLEPKNFQGSAGVKNKFSELFQKEEEKQARLRMPHILPPKYHMYSPDFADIITNYNSDISHYQFYLMT